MIDDSSSFDSDNNSFSLTSENKININYYLEMVDSKNLPTEDKFDCYFGEKDIEIYSLNYSEAFQKMKIFDVIYPENISLFTILDIYNSSNDETTLLKRKRSLKRENRKKDLDNIFKKIKTDFFNNALFKGFNGKLKNIGSRLDLERFPQRLVSDTKKERNKKLLNMTLLEIFEEKDLYKEKELKNYYHNLKVVKSKDVQDNFELTMILNKKCYELFEEYLNSEEFQDKIERLKGKNTDDYIEKYINAAKHFIGHLSSE